jgi:hypothetical protein
LKLLLPLLRRPCLAHLSCALLSFSFFVHSLSLL